MSNLNNENFLTEINTFLEQQVRGVGDSCQPLFDAIRYSLCDGGKRIRPLLFLTFYSFKKEDWRVAVPFASAIEMIHTASLIHDDMPCMDNDDLRRGKATLHCAMGESVAMVAGDALLNLAYETMLQAASDENALKAVQTIARSAGVYGVQGGQYLDTEVSSKDDALIFDTYQRKTAALIEASCVAAVQLAGGTAEEERAAQIYGKNIGLAFQIQDDLLDVFGNADVMGKATGNDEKCKKTTYLTLHGADAAKEKVCTLLKEAKDALDVFGLQSEILRVFADELSKREK